MSKHCVAYHNVEKMDRTLGEGDPLPVVAKKSLTNLVGSTVWMVVGDAVKKSTKKQYWTGSSDCD